jgi:addiction module HigA family antidote
MDFGKNRMKEMKEPTTPGEILQKEFLAPHKISRKMLADHLGWDVKQIDRICNNQSAITAIKAIALGSAFGIRPEFWLNAQAQTDLWNNRKLDTISLLPCIPISKKEISVEKNITIPRIKQTAGRTGKYPFHKMKIGDSFFIPCRNPASNGEMRKCRSRAISSLSKFNDKNGTKIKITTRSVKTGIRVWRTE